MNPAKPKLSDFGIGDCVVIRHFSDYWNNCKGIVYKIDEKYVYLTGADKRFDPYKLAGTWSEAGFSPSNVEFANYDYELACQVLGEDYFA